MQLSETIKLYLSKEQRNLIVMTMMEYIDTVNNLVSDMSISTVFDTESDRFFYIF